jgi:glycosyltransferase involved in cell wall biosynthesis
MRVAMICSEASISCGVSDYTQHLIYALRENKVHVELIAQSNWGILNVSDLLSRLNKFKPDIVHIQYPAALYGKSLGLQIFLLVSLGKWSIVTTIHEFSHTHILRRIVTLIFGFSKKIILTNEFEEKAINSFFPLSKNKFSTIPIGNSIPFLHKNHSITTKLGLYFGLIRPNKGIEDFLELANLCFKTQSDYDFLIAGSIQLGAETYFQKLIDQSHHLTNLKWELDPSASEVAQLFSNSNFVYLPFPDGASERRSSLIAALGNNIPIITTLGLQTPESFKGIMEFATDPKNALEILSRWDKDKAIPESLKSKALEYSHRFNWNSIATLHTNLYQKIYYKY